MDASSFDERQLDEWAAYQRQKSALVSFKDSFPSVHAINKVAGLDVTFLDAHQDSGSNAIGVAVLVIMQFDSYKVLYRDSIIQTTNVPYISGFLGFRELPYAKELFSRLHADAPEMMPDVTFVDGNGIYHERRFGFASQLGVELGITTIGVSKSFLKVSGLKEDFYFEKAPKLATLRPIQTETGESLGAALYAPNSRHPMFVSVGHQISLQSAISITRRVSRYKTPEPIRAADLFSRELARTLSPPRTAPQASRSVPSS